MTKLRFLVLTHFIAVAFSLTTAAAAALPPGFPAFQKSEYRPAALGRREPNLQIDFPGAAAARGASIGKATVAVLIDQQGKAADVLTVSYTDRAFGAALAEKVKVLSFEPALFRGTAVPSRLDLTYQFESSITMTAMDATQLPAGLARIKFQHQPVAESALDKPLEFTHVVLPMLPEDYPQPTDGKPVRVFVTFFIDADGKVRVPNVESAPSPQLVPDALRVVQQWSFKPATAKGKPALVLAGRPVRFLTPADAQRASAKQE